MVFLKCCKKSWLLHNPNNYLVIGSLFEAYQIVGASEPACGGERKNLGCKTRDACASNSASVVGATDGSHDVYPST